MKKAPKRFRKGYVDGGETTNDDPKKPLGLKMTPAEWDALNKKHGNEPYPYSSPKSTGHKDYYDPKLFKVSQNPDTKETYSEALTAEGKGKINADIYGYEYQAPPKVKTPTHIAGYNNVDPRTGKQIPYQDTEILKKAKGGTVKKMTKAPCKMKKGGTC